jgi:predicted phosphodiesterase
MKKYFEDGREPLFRFAIVSDTHLNPEEGDESSPWKANRHANDRARWVIDQINRADLDFVVHMGDIVHPLPHSPTYNSAAGAALKAFGKIEAPLYFIPGNHDIGDKNNPTMPAPVVEDFSLDLFTKWFGPLYRSFDHKGVHFILINTLALNSGLDHEGVHSRWLEDDLKANLGKRIHVFSHYPPYILEPGEPSNYDNLDEPGRSWLLRLLRRHEVEAFFAGHVHQFIYNKFGSTDCHNIPATSFVRQDYSEMFRIEAADEYGRNDVQKLGWCTVDVYEETHVAHIHRSHGATLQEGERLHQENRIDTYCAKGSGGALLGVHLRHPWAEEIDLPNNGPLDEFIRKRVRNDYALLGLWECGISKLRVPMSDLANERIRARMAALKEVGHRFNVFSLGIPQETDLGVLRRNSDLVNSLEIVLPWREVKESIQHLIKFRQKVPVSLFLANIESSADRGYEGSRFSHFVSSGFRVDQMEGIAEFMKFEKASVAADGFVFEVGLNESPWDTIRAIGAYADNNGFRAVANVRMASDNPAEYLSNDVHVANRVAEAMVAASATPIVDVFIDTFMDVDRGYFPRIGLYDRRYNRRLGSYVFANMHAALDEYGSCTSLGHRWEGDDGWTCAFETDRASISLFLPSPNRLHGRTAELPHKTDLGGSGKGKLLDLWSGTISDAVWRKKDEGISILNPSPCGVPSLLIIERWV